MTRAEGLSPNQRGILLMTVGMALFAIEDMLIKLMAAHLPPGQIILSLGVAGTLIFGAVAARRGMWPLSGDLWSPAVLGRNLSEMLGTFGFVLAVAQAPLTTVTAIFQATPLAVTLGAALFLGERVGWRRWTAIAVGFLGVLVVVRPGGEGFQPASLWALVAVVGLGARDLFTRRIPQRIDSLLLVVWGFAAVGLVGAGQLLVSGGAVVPTPPEGALLLGAVIVGAGAYWSLTEALRAGDVSAVAPFRYSRLVFALVIGMLVFGERPDGWTLLGAGLIVGSGLYSLLRERARARALAAVASAAALPTGAPPR